jgi:aryl-alcohol dehydrogenase-like predicted oxidoreductase
VSAIGLGTWQFGSMEWGYGPGYASEQAPAIVRRAIDLGVNLIDTAEVYGFGRSERIVGRAIEGMRDQVVVATKIFPVAALGPVVANRARASARRLGVDTIDLYQVHWPNPVIPVALTMRELARLVDEGLVRHVGVSNFSADAWRQAEASLGAPVVSNQVRYSLVDRRPEAEVLPHAQAAGRLVIAYSPLGQGLLSARYGPENRPGGLRSTTKEFLPENLRRAEPLLDELRRVARAHDATPAQVALAWLIRRPNVVVIPGASSVSQLEANVAAVDLELTDEEDESLTSASDSYRPISGLEATSHRARAIGEQIAGRLSGLVRQARP